jgi:hypothetical protein
LKKTTLAQRLMDKAEPRGGEMSRRLLSTVVVLAALTGVLATTVASAGAQQSFPQGRYTSPLVAADFTRYGGKMDASFPHPWIITMRKGSWHTNEHPSFGGRYLLHGNRITFVVNYPLEGAGGRQTLTWKYDHQRLAFKIVAGVEDGDQAIYLAHPWRRIGP